MLLREGGGTHVAVLAVQAIRRMRGGAQSQLMLGADGKLWVVKFQNNPQHLRVLANELIATRLAEAVGLTVPATDVIEVTEWLVENSPEMVVDLARGGRERCAPGLQFGSQFVGGLAVGVGPGRVLDYLPEEQLSEVRNVAEFAGMLVIDKWTGNANGRQAVFSRKVRERKYTATFIDQGYCFHAGEWKFEDAPLRGVYGRNKVYAGITGWESFDPWLTRVEQMSEETLWSIAEVVPPEWYGGNTAEIEQLIQEMLARRSRVRELIVSFRDSNREPFPNWGRKIVPPSVMGTPNFVM
ncbi:HipA family kinase [Terriglobus saanensis]|uniref:HipA domain protein n=1 Tax=Terriglobus saanensis (strain ATCC BAA-1853 / DSM 23119 / SP1PR4) TaxID=401053 RepID=E8UYZ1_TERSS|nr:HipA family kinase [Terriglobus saanensis]ADV80936.1 HipA domain protein [Terriglobus saanensis SP1PR4]